MHPIPLTVIVGTIDPWPAIGPCLDSLHAQVVAQGAEMLVLDGHGSGFPEDVAARYPGLTRILAEGASVFQMRAAGMRVARGDVVAVTEDHCRAAPDWCERIVAAHREWPDASAIGGAVENGATAHVVDWAHFLMGLAAWMPPLPRGAHRRAVHQATISYKRAFAPRESPSWGYMEWMWNEELFRRGHVLVSDDRIRVAHVQSFGMRGTCAIHFHDGRSIAAFRAQGIGMGEHLLRLLVAASGMAPLVFLRACVSAAPKVPPARLLSCAPMIALLSVCRAAGAVAGFTAGAGRSPLHIH